MKAAHCSGNPCVVCGHAGDTNLHYGALCCSACRNFFRRAVRKGSNLQPCVTGTGCCLQLTEPKRKCKMCRLQMCFRNGMQKESVQNPRDSIRRILTHVKPAIIKMEHQSFSMCGSVSPSELKQSDIIHHGSTKSVVYFNVPLSHKLPPLSDPNDTRALIQGALSFNCYLRNAIETSLRADRQQQLQENQSAAVEETSRFKFPNLSVSMKILKVLCYEILHAVKLLDTFAALQLKDQMKLLTVFCGSGIILDMAQRSKSLKDIVLCADNIHALGRQRNTEIVTNVLDILLPAFRFLSPDDLEFSLLMLIMLWDADACSNESRPIVGELRTKCLIALEYYVHNKPSGDGSRYASLLLLTASVEQIRSRNFKDAPRWVRDADPLVKEIFRRHDN